MAATSTTLAIYRNWQKKGEISNEPFDTFIFYWVAFNCFYSSFSQKNNDSEALKKIKEDSEISDLRDEVLKTAKHDIVKLKSICPINDMRIGKVQNTNIVSGTFDEVLDVLYQIRCNLFHGNKDGDSDRDLKVVKKAIPVLRKIVEIFGAEEKYFT